MIDPARVLATIALAALIAGCITPSDPRLDDSDVDGWPPAAGGPAIPPGVEPTADSLGVPTSIVSEIPTSSPASNAGAVDAVPPADGVLNAIWIGDGRVVVGGFEGPQFAATILVFDGTSWSAADVPEAPGQITGIAELGNRLIAVGNGLPTIRNGFIWESIDGRTWETARTIEDAALYDVVSGHGAIVAAGARIDTEMHATAAAWISSDGATWKQAEVAGSAAASIGSITTTSKGFAATGDRPLGEAQPIWAASVATSWSAQDNDLSDRLLLIDIAPWTEGLALAGASGKSGDQHPFVAVSATGRRWQRTNLSTAEGYASAVAVGNDGLVVAGVDGDRLTLWSLRDGSWDAETIEEGGSSISALCWDPSRGLVAVGARGGRHALWVFAGH